MGFFSDLKEDLAQAVNELTEDKAEQELLAEEERLREELSGMEGEFRMNGVEESATTIEELAQFVEEERYVTPEEADEYLTDVSQLESAVTAGYVENLLNVDEDDENTLEEMYSDMVEGLSDTEESADGLLEETSDEKVSDAVSEIVADQEAPEEMEEVEELEEVEEIEDSVMEQNVIISEIEENDYVSVANEDAEVGIIPTGMIVTGDISTAGALDLKGTVLGNIEIGGKLNISGSIQGNAKAVELFAQAAKITGDVECDNSVKIGNNSVVIGNISARSAVIAGAVKQFW